MKFKTMQHIILHSTKNKQTMKQERKNNEI